MAASHDEEAGLSNMEEESSEGSSEAGSQDDDDRALGLSSAPPEFYDPAADNKDEAWAGRMRRGQRSDAVLSCPLCFATLCIDCQQHERFENQFRALFVMNCKVKTSEVVKFKSPASRQQQRRQRKAAQQQQQQQPGPGPGSEAVEAEGQEQPLQPLQQQQLEQQQQQQPAEDQLNPVLCGVCDTEVGLRDLADGTYHFFHAVASNS